jgi:hypothetical protein
MPTPTNPAVPKRARRRAHPPFAGAVVGALATFLVLLGSTVVSDAPRHLPDVVNETLAAAEMFDGLPPHDFESANDVHAHAPARRHNDPGLQMSYEVPT